MNNKVTIICNSFVYPHRKKVERIEEI
jgi:hypothetical protein